MVLALGYGVLFASRLSGPGFVRGAVYAVVPWLLAQVVVMPMMGAGSFSRSVLAVGASLVAHSIYGAVLGAICGARDPVSEQAGAPARTT